MKRTLYFAPSATAMLRQIDRRLVAEVWKIIDSLLENPETVSYRSDLQDPSIYGITVAGDITIWFEILDEQHAIRVLDIEG
ncbi:MAG: hypothetical protein R3E79_28430 [Caldilineaceae bacterium]